MSEKYFIPRKLCMAWGPQNVCRLAFFCQPINLVLNIFNQLLVVIVPIQQKLD